MSFPSRSCSIRGRNHYAIFRNIIQMSRNNHEIDRRLNFALLTKYPCLCFNHEPPLNCFHSAVTSAFFFLSSPTPCRANELLEQRTWRKADRKFFYRGICNESTLCGGLLRAERSIEVMVAFHEASLAAGSEDVMNDRTCLSL